eukprot:8731920-Pyramimonas_sp.AAC.1
MPPCLTPTRPLLNTFSSARRASQAICSAPSRRSRTSCAPNDPLMTPLRPPNDPFQPGNLERSVEALADRWASSFSAEVAASFLGDHSKADQVE